MADFDPGNTTKYGDISQAQLIALSGGTLTSGTQTEPASGKNKYDPNNIVKWGLQNSVSLAALSQGVLVVGGGGGGVDGVVTAATIGTAAARTASITPERQVFGVSDVTALLAAGGAGATAPVPLSVAFTGSPTYIWARSVDFASGVEVTPWTIIATSPTSPYVGSFAMKEYNGWQKLEIRAAAATTAQVTTANRIGAGLLIGIEGQSQARYFLTNVSTGGTVTAGDLISVYGRTGLLEAATGGNGGDPTFGPLGWYMASFNGTVSGTVVLGGGGNGAAEFGNLMNAKLSVPIGFVANAPGGRDIAYLNGAVNKPQVLARYAETGRPNYIFLLSHGTADAQAGTAEATYLAGLETLKTWHDSDAFAAPRQKYGVMELMQQNDASVTNCLPTRRSQQNFKLNHPTDTFDLGSANAAYLQADGVHQDATGNIDIGRRANVALQKEMSLAGVVGSRGPTIVGIARNAGGANIRVTVQLRDGATALSSCNATSGGGALTTRAFTVVLESNPTTTYTLDTVTLNTGTPAAGQAEFTVHCTTVPPGPVRLTNAKSTYPGPQAICDNVALPNDTRGGLLQNDTIGFVTSL